MKREFIHGTWQKNRSFSPAVITEGSDQRMIWLAGYGAPQTPDGASLAGDFEAQTRQSFANIEAFLQKSGAKLSDIVQMTVFIIDSRYGNAFTELRKEYFPDGNFPGSAMISVAGFAQPEMMVEKPGHRCRRRLGRFALPPEVPQNSDQGLHRRCNRAVLTQGETDRP